MENDSSTTVKTNFGEYLQGSPLSYQLPSVDCIGIQTKIYGELPFELPVLSDDWNEYEHGFQNVDLTFITLSPKDASQLECDTRAREQSGSAKWKLERAKRITASQFGQVIKRKAAVTEKFLTESFQGKTNIKLDFKTFISSSFSLSNSVKRSVSRSFSWQGLHSVFSSPFPIPRELVFDKR